MAKKRRYNLDEYQALRSAYDRGYSRTDIFITLIKPFGFIFIYTYLLYYYWWLSLIFAIGAAIFQYRNLNLMVAQRDYDDDAFAQRNKFINNLTQILANSGTTTLDGLLEVRKRTDGEFKDDLGQLLLVLRRADVSKIRAAFEELTNKYSNDVIFEQYMDQIETAILDGRNNIEILKDIRTFHNAIKGKRDVFKELKHKRAMNFKVITVLLLAGVTLLSFLVGGISQYIEIYAHTPFGWVCNTLFLLGIFMVFRAHLKKQRDDEIMEVDI